MPVSSTPLVLVRTVASRQIVTVASEEALAAGVRAEMSLAEANALCPGLAHADHEPQRDARALFALARWLVRFSPSIMVDESVVAEEDSPRHAIYLDLTGCGRVFGGLGRLLRQVADALRRMRLGFSAAVAPTLGAAWALTFSPDAQRRVFDEGDLGAALPPLPVGTLRLDPDAIALLHHLGVETIGQLLKLPRNALPARFGGDVLRRVDQAFGRAFEPLVPLPHHEPVEASVDFDGLVQAPEALWEAFHRLLDRVVADLTRRGCGAKQIEATFVRPDLEPMRKTIHLSAPTRDGVTIFNLLRCALDTLVPAKKGGRGRVRAGCHGHASGNLSVPQSLPAWPCPPSRGTEDMATRHGPGPATMVGRHGHGTRSVQEKIRHGHGYMPMPPAVVAPRRTREQFHPEGFTGLHLRVTHFERVSDDQSSMVDQASQSGRRELARLIERLRARLGEEVLAQAELAESHVPELAYQGQGDKGTRGQGEAKSPRRLVTLSPCPLVCPRPLHLFPTPIEIRAMLSPSDVREGRPISFVHEGHVHRVDHAIGPERIAGHWWCGRHKTRDYFDASDADTGERFWLFRVVETSRWYLHGVFE